jgi:hypothetical protein
MQTGSKSTREGHSVDRGLTRIVVISMLLTVGLLGGPGSASARPTAEFTVPGSNGYAVDVTKARNLVIVTVASKRPPFATISSAGAVRLANPHNVAVTKYVAPDFPGPESIDANLGAFGTIAVGFQPSGERKVTKVSLGAGSERCQGAEKIVRRLGTFNGTIRFAGENGYTSVDLTSAEGSIGTPPPSRCVTALEQHRGAMASASSGAPIETILDAHSLTESGVVGFSAVTSGKAVRFAAQSIESGEYVNVLREAIATDSQRAFLVSGSLESASVVPPGPFSGRAALRGAAWRGSLSVAFPGAIVPLTGSPFQVKLQRINPELF